MMPPNPPMGPQTTDESFLRVNAERADQAQFQKLLDGMAARGTMPKEVVPLASADQPAPKEDTSIMDYVGKLAGKGAKGLAHGIAEIPSQMVGGYFDFYKNTGKAVSSLGDWLDENASFLQGGATPEEIQKQKDQRQQLREAANVNRGLAPDAEFSAKNITGVGQEPETVIGGLTREITKLMVGMAPAMKGLQAAGMSAWAASPLAGAASMFFGMDPDKPNLVNLLRENFPQLAPAITEFLATDPNDNEAVNRLRNAAEGLWTGVAAEGVIRGLGVARSWNAARIQEAKKARLGLSAEDAATQERLAAEFVQKSTAGVPPDAAPFTITVAPVQTAAEKLAEVSADVGPSVPGQVTAKAIGETVRKVGKAATLDDLKVNINWENIDKGNITGVIGEIADAMKGRISAAKRGVITLEAQGKMAEALNLTPEDMIVRRIGEAFPAEKLIAAGKVLDASHARLLELARIAEFPTSSAADAFRVNEQMVTHMAILESFLGASGEAGRALGALRAVHASGNVARAQAMQEFLLKTGGKEGAERLSSLIIQMNADGVPAGGMNAALNRGWGKWTWDAYKEAYALSYLWKPVTQIRNIIGNTANALQQSIDRSFAEKYSFILGRNVDDAVVNGEAAAYLRGQLGAFGEAFSTAWKAAKTGERQFMPMQTGAPTEADLVTKGASALDPTITAKSAAQEAGKSAVEQAAFAGTTMGKAIDYIGHSVRFPGRFLSAGDDFFKVIAYRGEIEAQAHRLAMAEGLTGRPYIDRVAGLIAKPPENIQLSAMNHANYATFNDAPGNIGKGVLSLRSSIQPLYLVVPYVRTPVRLISNSVEHSPLAFLVKRWRDDISAGGPATDMALGKMTAGSAATALLFDYARNGNLSGPLPHEEGWRQSMEGAGIRPFSLQRPGGMQVGITGMGQLAPQIAFAGAMNQMMQNRDIHPEAYDTLDEWVNTAITIAAFSLTDQTYMTGFSRLMGALDTYKRGNQSALGTYLRDLGGSALSAAVPGMPLVRAVGGAMDDQQRQVSSWWDALFFKNMPGFSARLIPVRDVFGHEIKNQPAGAAGQLYNFVMPFRLSWKNDHPAFNEMVRLRTGLQRIEWSAPFMDVQVNFRDHPEVLDYYRRLAGNELEHNPQTREPIGFEDFINRMVQGDDPRFSYIYANKSEPDGTGTDSGKATYIKHWFHLYKQAAQQQIMSEAPWRFPEFHAEIKAGIAHKERQKLTIPYQDSGYDERRTERKTEDIREIQAPLPDRHGRPAVGSGGSFTVPSR